MAVDVIIDHVDAFQNNDLIRVRANVRVNFVSLILLFFLIEYLSQTKILLFDGLVRVIVCLWTELDFFDFMGTRLL